MFINSRHVVSPLVSYAIKAGYGHRIDEKRHPIFVVHLTVPPDQVDVNVHPQKREVRFAKEEWLREFLKRATSEVFQITAWNPSGSAGSFQNFDRPSFADAPLRFKEETREPSLTVGPSVIGMVRHYLLLDASTMEGEGDGIVWVDLQAAQKEVLLKELQEKGSSQGLLLPIPLSLTHREQNALEEKKKIVEQIGFSVEQSGKDAFMIQAIPSCLEMRDGAEALKLILQHDDEIPTFASFAVRGKTAFMLQEALALWKKVQGAGDKTMIAKTGMHVVRNFFK